MVKIPFQADDASATFVDPDPWTVIQTVATIAGTIGVFIQIGMAYRDKTGILPASDTTSVDDMLAGAVQTAIHNVEALARFLARAKIDPPDTLDRRFKYAETTMLIDRSEFARFKRIATSLIHSLDIVQGLSFTIIQHHPERAKQLGRELSDEIDDFARRINSFMDGEMTNGAVIDECLTMIRAFNRVLQRLSGN